MTKVRYIAGVFAGIGLVAFLGSEFEVTNWFGWEPGDSSAVFLILMAIFFQLVADSGDVPS